MTIHCINCNFTCAKQETLLKHIATVHYGKKPFQCHICEDNFAQKMELKKHIKSNHEVKQVFKCTICNLKLTNKSRLARHVAYVHDGRISERISYKQSTIFFKNLAYFIIFPIFIDKISQPMIIKLFKLK